MSGSRGRWISAGTIALGVALLIALMAPATSLAVTHPIIINPVVTFPDPVLDSMVRAEINIPTGDIHARDLDSLTTLTAGDYGIAHLDGLEYATSLRELDLSGNSIATLTALAGLPDLQHVEFADNSISDVSPLAGKTSLTYLDISGNGITSISSLSGDTNLQHLDVSDNPNLTDISPIAALPNLQMFAAAGSNVSDITSVSGHTAMTELLIGRNPVANISALSAMTALTTLGLDSDPVQNLSPLSGLVNITNLNVSLDPHIIDLSPLSGMTKLNALSFSGGQVWNVSPLLAMHGSAPGRIYADDNWIDMTPGSDARGVLQTLSARGYEVFTSPQRTGGAISGVVHSSVGGVIGGVRVQLTGGPGANTNPATGAYLIGLVAPAVCTLTFTKPYYYPVVTPATVTASTTQIVNATMVPVLLAPTLTRSPSKPSVSFTRKHGRVKFTLSATLTDARGAVTGAGLWLQKRSGKKWTTLFSLTTDQGGKVSRTISATKAGTTSYRWYSPGNAADTAVTGSSQSVRVK